MLQSFDVRGARAAAAARLPGIRKAMQDLNIDGLLVPHDDEYLNEYTPPQFERLLWASGFSGSAGALLILADAAVLFIDGRYTEQARLETSAEWFDYEDLRAKPPWQWLRDNPGRVARLGFASLLHTQDEIARIEALDHLEAVPLERHPIDDLWTDRPERKGDAPFAHAIDYAGEYSASKRRRLGEAIRELGANVTVFVNPNASAWLLNIRGDDVPHTPVALCRTCLHADGTAVAFFRGHEISDELRAHIGNDVAIKDESDFGSYLRKLAADGSRVLYDKTTCPAYVYSVLADNGAVLCHGEDPLILARAIKNDAEISGARHAHRRDGVAMVRFLRWLDQNGATGITEIDAVRQLEAMRRDDDALQDISFDTISGSGPNGSIIHYRVSEASNRTLEDGDIFLVDSGGQYPSGTTDITRTVAIGAQSATRKDHFTRVLKGHIALATASFPADTCGYQLDVLARKPLWDAGLDYAHGTGHGVGTFLGVHEGPQSIAKRAATVPLQAGMILSNEPGYYREGEYGIRIENLVVVRESEIEGMLEFETLTLAPIDTRLVDNALLTESERSWLNNYHGAVRESLLPHLDAGDKAWLEKATTPI